MLADQHRPSCTRLTARAPTASSAPGHALQPQRRRRVRRDRVSTSAEGAAPDGPPLLRRTRQAQPVPAGSAKALRTTGRTRSQDHVRGSAANRSLPKVRRLLGYQRVTQCGVGAELEQVHGLGQQDRRVGASHREETMYCFRSCHRIDRPLRVRWKRLQVALAAQRWQGSSTCSGRSVDRLRLRWCLPSGNDRHARPFRVAPTRARWRPAPRRAAGVQPPAGPSATSTRPAGPRRRGRACAALRRPSALGPGELRRPSAHIR